MARGHDPGIGHQKCPTGPKLRGKDSEPGKGPVTKDQSGTARDVDASWREGGGGHVGS
jgi:hypothetical protein